MGLEGITLSVIRQKDKYHMIHICGILKKNPKPHKTELTDTEDSSVVARGRGVGCYKINKSSGCSVQHGDYSSSHCTAYLKVAKRVDLKSSLHKKTKLVTT